MAEVTKKLTLQEAREQEDLLKQKDEQIARLQESLERVSTDFIEFISFYTNGGA